MHGYRRQKKQHTVSLHDGRSAVGFVNLRIFVSWTFPHGLETPTSLQYHNYSNCDYVIGFVSAIYIYKYIFIGNLYLYVYLSNYLDIFDMDERSMSQSASLNMSQVLVVVLFQYLMSLVQPSGSCGNCRWLWKHKNFLNTHYFRWYYRSDFPKGIFAIFKIHIFAHTQRQLFTLSLIP